ncbi:hypothetical protein [Nesterenkonia rhizosphaerae]|uniref:hypothetical protein n=1 Tax=Nesterenkonia rhizosphaerae TaxID=1348272 RepID=UPI0031F15BDB
MSALFDAATRTAESVVGTATGTALSESPEQVTADAAVLDIVGTELTAEETAAVVAVITQLRAAQAARADDDAGAAGPSDRTLQRHRRLAQDHHGLWGRPGGSSWRLAAGGLR